MVTKKNVLELLTRSLIYSLIVVLIDFVIVIFLQVVLNQVTVQLSLIMLLEGGIGLTVGGAVATYSPLGAKISEMLFQSKPMNAQRLKEAEKQARTWIATGAILVLTALLISAL